MVSVKTCWSTIRLLNDQREIIYGERRRVLDGENMRNAIYKMITDRVEDTVDHCVSDERRQKLGCSGAERVTDSGYSDAAVI